jgi:hypothetical protein
MVARNRREKEDMMRRGMAIVVLLLVVLGGVAIGIGSYNAGVSHGLTQAATGAQVVRVVGPGFGFFPFGLLFFPLFFFLIFGLLRGAFFGRRWRGYGPGRSHSEHWEKGPGARFEEWHRRDHEQVAGDHPGASAEA